MRKARMYDLGCKMLFGLDMRLWRMALEIAEAKPGECVLDVGCGTGRLTLAAGALVGPDGRAQGVDAAPEMIEVARRKAARAQSNAHFQVGLIEDLPFADGGFDLVMNTLVMHHLPSEVKSAGLAEVYRVLKPGGRFVAIDLQPPDEPVANLLARLFLGRHMAGSDITDSLAPLREAGFAGVESGPSPNSWFAFARGTK